MADIDLTAEGSETTIGGVIFQDADNIGSGTGNYEPFLAIRDNDGNEAGFNTDTDSNVASNPNIDQSKTHSVLLSTMPIIVIDGVEYFEIRLDINETNSDELVSLNQFKLYAGPNDLDPTVGTNLVDTLAELQSLDLVYDMDAGEDRRLLLNEVSTGSGTDDYSILIPVSLFDGYDLSTTYMFLYAEMGTQANIYDAEAGFEEFNIQSAGTLTGLKFSDVNSDGVRDLDGVDNVLGTEDDEVGVGGVTIFIDTDKDGVLDADERSTVTEDDGSYSFTGVAIGTHQIDEIVPTGSTQTTGPFETATIATVGQVVIVDPIGNHYPIPRVTIEKTFVNITDGGGVNSTTVINYAGDIANYTIDVTNNGETGLVDVQLTDALASTLTELETLDGFNTGDADKDNVLDIGETWHWTATQTAIQSDLDTNGGGDGTKDNSATVLATQEGVPSKQVTDTDDASAPIVPAPSIAITKVFNNWSGGDGDALGDFAGDIANYTIVVTNNGNVTLTNVVVTDPLTGNVYNVGILAPGASSAPLIETYTLTQADLDSNGTLEAANFTSGSIENTATATSTQTGPASASAVAPIVYAPAINVTKAVAAVDATGNGLADAEGDIIDYTIKIENTGNITLTGVTVTDTVEAYGATNATYVSGDTDSDGKLDVDEEWTYSASYTLTQADLDGKGGGNGLLDNVGTGDTSQTDPDSDSETVPLVYNPKVDLEKYVSVTGAAGVYVDADSNATNPDNSFLGPNNVNIGSDVWFKVTVANTGNITLTDVDISDENTTGGSPGTVFDLVVDGALTLNAINNFGATLTGDDGDGELDVGETWTIYYKQGFDPGQHINTAAVTTDENATDSDDAYYYSLINEGPGVGTPGFWGNLGGQFWDNVVGNETKSGPNFPEGELVYAVDSNNDGKIDAADKAGLLIGDYNQDGYTGDNPNTVAVEGPEDTLFIGLSDAKQLIDASQKTAKSDGVQMLGRDVVATWLNFLAGNNIGDADTDAKSPQHYIDDAVDWLQTFGGKSGNGAQSNLADNVKTETFDIYDPTHAMVKTNTTQWNSPQFAGDSHSASQMHNALDYYNNHGQTEPGGTQYAHDRDDGTFATALKVVQSAEYVGLADYPSGDAVHDSSIMTTEQMMVV